MAGVTVIGIGLTMGTIGVGSSVDQNHSAILMTAALAAYDDPNVCFDESSSPPECAMQQDAETGSVVSLALALTGFSIAGAAGMWTLLAALAPERHVADMPVRAMLGPVPGGGALVLTGSF